MTRIPLSRALAYASGLDAGNARMRKAGRKRWSREDATEAATVTNRLLYHLEPPAIQEAMRRDGIV